MKALQGLVILAVGTAVAVTASSALVAAAAVLTVHFYHLFGG